MKTIEKTFYTFSELEKAKETVYYYVDVDDIRTEESLGEYLSFATTSQAEAETVREKLEETWEKGWGKSPDYSVETCLGEDLENIGLHPAGGVL